MKSSTHSWLYIAQENHISIKFCVFFLFPQLFNKWKRKEKKRKEKKKKHIFFLLGYKTEENVIQRNFEENVPIPKAESTTSSCYWMYLCNKEKTKLSCCKINKTHKIRVLCGVNHEDLKQLFHVSKLIREALSKPHNPSSFKKFKP